MDLGMKLGNEAVSIAALAGLNAMHDSIALVRNSLIPIGIYAFRVVDEGGKKETKENGVTETQIPAAIIGVVGWPASPEYQGLDPASYVGFRCTWAIPMFDVGRAFGQIKAWAMDTGFRTAETEFDKQLKAMAGHQFVARVSHRPDKVDKTKFYHFMDPYFGANGRPYPMGPGVKLLGAAA